MTGANEEVEMDKTTLIVSAGQYETCAIKIVVRHTTEAGLMRRARQLSREHSVYGDNWRGWIPANVAIASKDDQWGRNQIIGGNWCEPANGWLDL
jgi:hypothetical protein